MNTIHKGMCSVIIPTYKRADMLLQTIQSVLNQTYGNIEIIVVDDNGKGTEYQLATEKLLEEYIAQKKIAYIAHECNKNGSAARNTGLKHSHGEYINFLDDDDKLYPTKLEKQVYRLQHTDDTVGATYCNSKIMHFQNITHKLIEKESNICMEGNLCREYILGLARFNTSMILFKRNAIESINGFNESFVRHQDYEMMIRYFRHYRIVCTSKEPLAIYDLTSIRINTPNCEKDYKMKEKLLLLFAEDFEKIGAKNEISHYLWLRCAINSALKLNKEYVHKSLSQSRKYGKITIPEYFKLLKALIVGCLKNK